MADTSDSQVRMNENTPKAAKDKNCPYCAQAFTSSSLGRHLDLYIKPHNPKKPDGIHDVEEIRRTRGGVTRRQPKGTAGRRQTSTPAGTPAGPSQRNERNDESGDESSMARSPSKEGGAPTTSAAGFPVGPGNRWEAVNTTTQHPATPSGAAGDESRISTTGYVPARSLSRQAQKAQLDMRQKLQDALDDARAAELALREITHAWRAAKQQVDVPSTPFDFNPLTMDFPALTLQCLPSMPTLFASTPLPTPSSWSTSPPGEGQFESLKLHFQSQFHKSRAKSVAQAEARHARPGPLQAPSSGPTDARQAVEMAKRRADEAELATQKHLEAAYSSWNKLSPERKTELWVLELARGLATKQNDNERLATANSGLTQEITSLKSQLEQIRTKAPTHLPMSERALVEIQDAALAHGRTPFGLDDNHVDTDTYVASAIRRWKGVVTSNRTYSSGMRAQRPLGVSVAGGPVTPAASYQGPAAGQPRTRLGPPPIPVTFSVSTPASLAPTGGAQRPARRGARAGAAPARQPLPSGNAGNASAPTAPGTPRVSAASAPAAPQAPAAPDSQSSVTREVSQPVTTKTEPQSDEMEVEEAEAEAEAEEEEDEEEEEEEEEEDEEDEDEDEEEEEEADDGEDEDDGDDDTTPPAQQSQQAPTAPGAGEGGAPGAPGGGDADDNDDEDDEMSDKDADAEMEDDGDEFAHMHTPLNMSMSSTGSEQKPEFSYTRNAAQQIPRTAGNTSASLINSSRMMSNMGLAMPALSSESMYMD